MPVVPAGTTTVVVSLAATLVLTRMLPGPPGAAPIHPGAGGAAGERPPPAAALPPIVRLMFSLGVVMALAWSAVSQFVIPLRGTREFGLERAGISGLLSVAQRTWSCSCRWAGWPIASEGCR